MALLSTLLWLSPLAALGGAEPVSFRDEIVPLIERAGERELLGGLGALEIEDVGEIRRLGEESQFRGERVCPCVFEVWTPGRTHFAGLLLVHTRWHVEAGGRGLVQDFSGLEFALGF